MSVVHQQYATSTIDEAAEVLTSVFSDSGVRLSDADGVFGYSQDYRGAAGIAAVSQRFAGGLQAASAASDTVFIGWTEHGSTTYRVGSHELSGDTGPVWSGRTAVHADVDHAVNRALLIDRAAFAAAARMSPRGLHAAFRQHLDETPMQRHRRGRLDRVRADLVAADPDHATAAAIGRRWGFTHLGRFAASYFEAFGALPGSTLRD